METCIPLSLRIHEEAVNVVSRFEEKIFQTALDQQDYIRKISVKMLSLESKHQSSMNYPGVGGVKRVIMKNVKVRDRGKKRWDGMISKSKRNESLSTVWIQTPEDIISLLFNYMPLPTLCRFKCVCKSWNTQIRNKCKGTWYIRTVMEVSMVGFSLMEEDSTVWTKLPLHIECEDKQHRMFVSSNGLVCLQSTSYNGRIIVCNPLNKWITQLPPLPHVLHQLSFIESRYDPIISIAIQECHNDSTRFIVTCLVERKSSTWLEPVLHVYNSNDANWVTSDVILFGKEGGEIILNCYNWYDCMALCNNHLYLITMNPDDTCSLKFINVFNPCQDVKCLATWIKFSWQPPYNMHKDMYRGQRFNIRGQGYGMHNLLVCEKKIMIVAMVPLNEGSKWGTICIYTLEEETKKWEEISRLPLEMLPARNIRGLRLNSESFMAASGKNQVTLYFNSADWGCVYNVVSDNWYSAFGKARHRGSPFFAFQPSLLYL